MSYFFLLTLIQLKVSLYNLHFLINYLQLQNRLLFELKAGFSYLGIKRIISSVKNTKQKQLHYKKKISQVLFIFGKLPAGRRTRLGGRWFNRLHCFTIVNWH